MSERIEAERILCCSDIHGHAEALRQVLFSANWRPGKDQLILLGDYIDRGPRPREVVSELKILLRCPNVVALCGNHELMLWEYLQGEVSHENYMSNGGGATLRDYPSDEDALRADAEFLRQLPRYHETEDYIFVHAGLKPGVSLQDQDERDLLWIREKFIENYRGKTVVFGHSPTIFVNGTREVFWGCDKIGVDTGAAYGGLLTMLELPSGETYSVAPDTSSEQVGQS